MDQGSKKIIAMSVTDKREAELKSVNMEKIGLEKCLTQTAQLNIEEITTDAHPQISKYLCEFLIKYCLIVEITNMLYYIILLLITFCYWCMKTDHKLFFVGCMFKMSYFYRLPFLLQRKKISSTHLTHGMVLRICVLNFEM